jgi:hypothetical protein
MADPDQCRKDQLMVPLLRLPKSGSGLPWRAILAGHAGPNVTASDRALIVTQITLTVSIGNLPTDLLPGLYTLILTSRCSQRFPCLLLQFPTDCNPQSLMVSTLDYQYILVCGGRAGCHSDANTLIHVKQTRGRDLGNQTTA